MSTYADRMLTGLATMAALGFIGAEESRAWGRRSLLEVVAWTWRLAYEPRHKTPWYRRPTSARNAAAFRRQILNYAKVAGNLPTWWRRAMVSARKSYWRGTETLRHRRPEPVRLTLVLFLGSAILYMSGLVLYSAVAL